MRASPEKHPVASLELMAPAGSYAALTAAIRAGADSIYFGVGELNMRARAASPFTVSDMRRICRLSHGCGVKAYLALNVIVFDHELDELDAVLDAAADAGVDAVIATDVATILAARDRGLTVHISVQANISNMGAVRFYAQFADVLVLARELTLAQIESMVETLRAEEIRGPAGDLLKVEIFAHGALCVAHSGKCYMSLAHYNQSANRGACFQPCRRRYRVVDDQTGETLVVDGPYVMSPKDLCTVQHLDLLLAAGVSVLKLEGRARTADYVSTVTGVYRDAIGALATDAYGHDLFPEWMRRLESVFNRGFWLGGYYCGETLGEWTKADNSQATLAREQLGVVTNYYRRPGVMEFQLWKQTLEEGAQLLVEGPTTGALRFTLEGLRADDQPVAQAAKGAMITVAVPERVRRKDKVFRLVEKGADA